MTTNIYMTPQEIGDLDPNMRSHNSTWPAPNTFRDLLSDLRGLLFGPRRYGNLRSVTFPGGLKALGSRTLRPAHPNAVGFFARRRLASTGMLPGEMTPPSLGPSSEDAQPEFLLDTLGD